MGSAARTSRCEFGHAVAGFSITVGPILASSAATAGNRRAVYLSIGHVAGTRWWWPLKARRAALVVFLHELLEFVQRPADHMVLVTGVSDRLHVAWWSIL